MLDETILNPEFLATGAAAAAARATGQALPDTEDPSIPISLYWAQAARWDEVTACFYGNEYLKYNAIRYIPQLKKEKDDCYKRRLSLALFSPYFMRIVNAAVGLILRKPIVLKGGNEEWWENWRHDVDRQGSSLEAFCKRNLQIALVYGHCAMLADFPRMDGIRNLREQYEANLLPYLIQVEPWRLIGWREDKMARGPRIQQVRIREQVTVPKGRFGEETWQQVRVVEPGRYEVWRGKSAVPGAQGGAIGWELLPGREGRGTTGIDRIPISCTYSCKIGTFVSSPPLQDVAVMNLRHYRVQSKLLHALEVAGFPILTLTGWNSTDKGLDVDVASALALEMGGSAAYVEPASSSFAATQEELRSLEDQMSNLGIAILAQQKMVGETAAAKMLDRADTNSMLASISLSLEQALQSAVDRCAEFAEQEPPQVSLDRDFDSQTLDAQGIKAIESLFVTKVIDRQTALQLLHRGEIIQEEEMIEDILQRAEDEEAASMERDMARLEQEATIARAGEPPEDEER